ncbi:hypothetical protein BX285_4921 [Streptomyces sp. 1114.5]|uniref:hypothetical protein n=1 Tax=Streptomyces sp. 1114.5 TaxID=1938830 RepID=UPI000F1DEC8A|nr:hypothetical protein [Streptomyces sp. 1114.5]RKT10988.1 hypothetical protein BX285_4921 [Streptomyces sp. 1114.5]
MAVPRNLLAAALLACGTAAVLSGCTPADSGPAVAAASAAAVADEGADDFLDDEDFLAEEDEEGYSPAAEPSAESSADSAASTAAGPARAAADCTAPAQSPGHEVLVVVAAGPAELTAQPARYTCDPARYAPTGTPVHYGFAAAGVTATLVDRPHDDPARSVPLEDLITHLNDCLAERDPADPWGCHGNAYDVVLDSHGRIVRIGEVTVP